jgi:hypothetical protein
MHKVSTRISTRFFVVCALIALFGMGTTGFVLHTPKVQAASSPVKIMPLGDSITAGPGCWRAILWDNLQSAGYTNIHFVGTQQGGGCQTAYYDINHEGHGGFSAAGIASQNLLPGWLSATNPDIVLMHLGTNDIFANPATSTILAAYSTLVSQMRANNPNMRILVAQIIPMNPSGCSYCAQDVINLNAAIPAWAASLTTAQSPVIPVDQWTGFDATTDTVDGIHPNDTGFQKMAARWFPPLTAQLNTLMTPVPVTSTPTGITPTVQTTSTPTSTPTSGITPTSTPTPTPGSGGSSSCRVHYVVMSQWQGGFGASLTITNTGTTAMNGWTLQFAFANGQTITQLWNGSYTQSGSAVTVTNVSYNASILAGQSLSSAPGFNGSWNGTNAVPTAFTLNGTACTVV